MSVEYDNVNSKDKKAGYWSGSTHTIPIEIYSEEKMVFYLLWEL